MTTSLLSHPSLPFVLAALLVPLGGPLFRRSVSLLAPATALALLATLPLDVTAGFSALGHDWQLLRVDALSRVFALAFIVYALLAGIYAWQETAAGPRAASLVLAGAGVGVVFAGDLLTLFFFWEWLTIASLFLIWFGNTPASWAAGFRYLVFHLLGAVLLLTGVLLQLADGIVTFGAMDMAHPASWLILAGMLTNAAVPPLHAWLPDAYPRASIFGTVFLAAFTTKSAVYALVRGFAGLELLVWLGVIMALFGVFYAIMQNDLRRLLSYHIVSQVGFMVAGVGMGTALSLNGTTSHAFAHIFYKGLLMMSAGAVVYATGRGKLTDLGQLAGPMRWTLVLMMIGALSISGAPLLNGFVSKSMIISAAAYSELAPVEFLLLVAPMGTFLSTGLKMPWFTFYSKDNGARVLRPVPTSMYVAMGLTAGICFITGVVPGPTLYALLPFDATYDPFTAHHFVQVTQLLLGTALGFWLLRVKLAGDPTVTIDVDIVYRGPVVWVVDRTGALFEGVGAHVRRATGTAIGGAWTRLQLYPWREEAPTLAVQATVIIATLAVLAWLLMILGR
jgi:multicomponent Na+:H+ antiporter subunit D